MHHVAAGHDHYPTIAQRRQLTAQLKMVFRWLSPIDAQLHHRDISLRVHLDQHAPTAVIQTPFTGIGNHLRRGQQALQLCRQLW
ncbi:hypothetical protein D3C76_1616770 [compost metagenome]